MGKGKGKEKQEGGLGEVYRLILTQRPCATSVNRTEEKGKGGGGERGKVGRGKGEGERGKGGKGYT